MAPKKNNAPPSSSSSSSSSPSTPSAELKKLCDLALGFIRKGNPVKAHHILNDARHQHQNSAIFCRIWGPVLNFYANHSVDKNPVAKKRWKEDAVDSAHRATELSPYNLDFSICYVRLLVVVRDTGFEEAVKECERALAVASPIDFSLEDFREKAIQEASEMDVIVSHQEELRFLLNTIKNPDLSANFKKEMVKNAYAFKVRSQLQSLQSPEEWKAFLRLNVKEIREKYKDSFVEKALDWNHANKTWTFWVCPCCRDQKYEDSELHFQHVLKEHLGELSEELKPKEADQDLVDKLVKGSWEPIDVQALTKNDDQEWPLSDDTERKTLLKRIKGYIWMLSKDKCLAMSHLDKVERDAMGEVQALGVGVTGQSTNCIRFLDSKKLQQEITFLDSLMKACKTESHGPSDDAFLDSHESDVEIRVVLDDSLSHIDLDMKLLPSSEDTSCPGDETRSSPDVDSMLYRLYEHEHQNLREKVQAWYANRWSKTCQGGIILEKFEREYENLRSIYAEKRKLLTYQENLQFMKSRSEKILAEGENSAELILKEWKDDLADRKEAGEDVMISHISDFLQKAKTIKASRNGDDNKTASSLDNSCINAAFQEEEKSLDAKLGIVDAKILKNLDATRKSELNLARISAFDYLPLLVPLLQSHMLEVIEKKVVELAKGEPEAASKTSLEELLHEAEKKQIQENSRGKRSSSNSEKSKARKS